MRYQVPHLSISRRYLRTGLGPIRHSSTNKPTVSSTAVLPYFIGTVGGIALVGGGIYAYYHLSGAKKVVEKVSAVKERYDDAKATVAEKREATREKVEAAKDAAKKKATSIHEFWVTRGSRSKGDGDQ